MNIIYSYNKAEPEGSRWATEIAAASFDDVEFIPFNHGTFIDPGLHLEAWQLDRLFRDRDRRLMSMYEAVSALLRKHRADAIVVNHCPPYHPEYLRSLSTYKVLYSGDDPDATYRRNIPYLHAYDHVMYLDPAHSADIDMREKMLYCGMTNADLLPHGVMDHEFDPGLSEDRIMGGERDIDLVYVGSFFRQKVPLIARLKREFGARFKLYGLFRTKHNLYFNLRHGGRHWVRRIGYAERVALYQRAKIGFNIHWSEYGLGNQRLYQLPANGVLQISDCAAHMAHIFEPGSEVVTYTSADDLIAKVRHYLMDDGERRRIAAAGFRRVQREYRFRDLMRTMAAFIVRGMESISHARPSTMRAVSR